MLRYKLLRFSFMKIASVRSLSRSYQNVPNVNLAKCMSTKIPNEQPISLVEKFTTQNLEQDVSPNQTEQSSAEHEFMVRLKNDPDVFGSSSSTEPEVYDEGDLQEERHFENQPLASQKLSTKKYADMIKKYIKQRRIKEAIDVLEVRMLKEDRVKPESYIYNLLLGACGRVGYTKKAFSLFNNMKKRGLMPTGGTYTALFNACSNSPWPKDGLSRATHLRNIMIEKMFEPNDTTYNAMIKAFGRCGDLPTVFNIVDEMISKKFRLKDDTFNFLLQACISDTEAGFRHALLVWRKLVQYRIKPSVYTYNLMLRSIRDCGMGDEKTTQDVLGQILRDPKFIKAKDTKLIQQSGEDSTKIVAMPAEHGLIHSNQNVIDTSCPNLMAVVPTMGNIISVGEVKTAEDRLLLVGGLKGFMKNMEENEVKPSIKTFTQLLDCIPGNLESEKDLLRLRKKFDTEPDIDFFNMLIKKRSMRYDYENAREVLKLIAKRHYRPNLVTYGVLALACKTKEDALILIEEMKNASYTLNTQILGAMLHQACYHMNFPYVLEIMETTLRENVNPNKKFMERLEEFKKRMKHISNDYKNNPLASTVKFQKGHRLFQMRYKTWIQEVEVDETEDEHPWTQFRQETKTFTNTYRDGVARFKPRHTSLFKVKTSTKTKPFSKRMRS